MGSTTSRSLRPRLEPHEKFRRRKQKVRQRKTKKGYSRLLQKTVNEIIFEEAGKVDKGEIKWEKYSKSL